MIIKEANRKDIEARLASMGDYVKIDYLGGLLKNNLDYDTRRFVLVKLASLYKDKGMLAEAARLVGNAAEINTTYEGMVNDYTKAMELFIRGNHFDESDTPFNKAIASANNEKQKMAIRVKRKDFIKLQAEELMKKDKRKNAMLAYEKLNSMPELSADEKSKVQDILAGLYEKLGKVREFYGIKKNR